ncbi:uncharacterized protein [Diadema antillarum]|uniref:uncharacterized protein n=1 Tax=Diadema antillarum TaxID=105358 RepID=UPI003A866B6D
MSALPAFPPFVETDNNPGPQWTKWLSRFERLMVALDISSAKRKRALLLHYAGPKVDEIFDTLQNVGDDDDYDKAVDALNKYFQPKSNSMYEVYIFRQGKQEQTESLDQYVTRLRMLAKNCKFPDTDREIMAQVIAHCQSPKLRRQALSKGDDLTLTKLLDIGRALEASEAQARAFESSDTTHNAVNATRGRSLQRNRGRRPPRANKSSQFRSYKQDGQKQHVHNQNATRPQTTPKPSGTCYYCGGPYPHQTSCPAAGKQCKACNKMGHFAKVCRSSSRRGKINNVKDGDDVTGTSVTQPDDEYSFTIRDKIYSAQNGHKHLPTTQLMVGHKGMEVIIDSGATVNIMDAPTFHDLKTTHKFILHKAHSHIFPYGSDEPIPVIGVVNVPLQTKQHTRCDAEFFVVKSNTGNLLSFETASVLQLITINQVFTSTTLTDEIFTKYATLFQGTGKVKGKQIKLHINHEVRPKQQKHRLSRSTRERTWRRNWRD